MVSTQAARDVARDALADARLYKGVGEDAT
jgi:hypothetical protein